MLPLQGAHGEKPPKLPRNPVSAQWALMLTPGGGTGWAVPATLVAFHLLGGEKAQLSVMPTGQSVWPWTSLEHICFHHWL